MTSAAAIAVAGLAVALGGLVQSGAGLGLGLVAAPVVTLVAPALMPGSMLVTGAMLPLLVLARDVRHIDWPGVSWALAGRLAGTLAGVWVVAHLPQRALTVVVAVVVLLVVAVTVAGWAVPRNRWTLLGAGVVSGTTGTSTSIGGPPVALLYTDGTGPQVRATLSVFFFAGNTVAVTALALSGHLPGRDLATGLVFLLLAGAGFAAAARLRRFLDAGWIRTAVLALAAGSAIVLLARGLLA